MKRLYDLAQDPYEMHDLLAGGIFPALAAELDVWPEQLLRHPPQLPEQPVIPLDVRDSQRQH